MNRARYDSLVLEASLMREKNRVNPNFTVCILILHLTEFMLNDVPKENTCVVIVLIVANAVCHCLCVALCIQVDVTNKTTLLILHHKCCLFFTILSL